MLWQLVVAAAAACVAWWFTRRRLHRLAAELPSPLKSYPIIGHAYMFFGTSEDRMTTLQKVGLATNQQGGLCSLWLAHRLFISMTDPAAIEEVTKSCLDKDEFLMKFTWTVIGNGSIFAPVNIWRQRRKIMASFFGLKNLDGIVPVFNKKSNTMVELMRAEVGAGDFSIWKYLNSYTFDAACETVTGINMNSQEDHGHRYVLCAINEVTEMRASRMFQPWLHPDFVYKRIPVYKQFQHHLQRCTPFFDKSTAIPSDGMANGYSDVELYEELMVMVIAATDSSAVAAAFTAVLLSRYPAVQERVYQELQEVFGESDRAVTLKDLLQLKYLEAVIKETMRLYPPVPIVVREVHADIVLPSGTTLVNGSSIMIHIWGAHRNPSYWGADAELFRPERFLQGPLPHPAMFIPFSYSVRGCIGSTYAMRSAKTVLANLVRRYRVLPPAGARAADLTRPLPVTFSLTMKPTDDFIVRVEERN